MTAQPLAKLASRISKFLLMLSSSHSAEVYAASRAIDRTERRAGLDWHALVRALVQPAGAPPGDDLARAEALQDHPALTAWERRFIADLCRRLRAGFPLTPTQHADLQRLYREILP